MCKDDKLKDSIIKALVRRAIGYKTSESVEEYVFNDGVKEPTKIKVTYKEIPPDITAVKTLLDIQSQNDDSDLSVEELEKEKLRLIKELLKEEKNNDNKKG